METVEKAKVKVAIVEVPGKCLKKKISKIRPFEGKEMYILGKFYGMCGRRYII